MNLNKLKETAKKILAVPFIRKFISRFNYGLYGLLSLSKAFAIPFHFIFTHFFDREIFAFTNAVHQYNRSARDVFSSNVVIRRNIHRLEKGLIMENRRTRFALDYIQETVECYTSILARSADTRLELGEIHWAHDVLSEYFSVVDKTHPLLGKLSEEFGRLPEPEKMEKSGPFVPYASSKRTGLSIPSYEDFLHLSQKRRSVRWFLDKKVPRGLVDKAIEAASLAPSACNRQPFKYLIFDDRELAKEIANIPFGTSGYADNIPTVIVLVGDLSNYFSSRDRHTIYIDASLSAMAFMYALETLGLSSVAINWPDFGLLESKMKKKLNLKLYERPVLLMGVGYAKKSGKIPYSKKKPLNELRSYNELRD